MKGVKVKKFEDVVPVVKSLYASDESTGAWLLSFDNDDVLQSIDGIDLHQDYDRCICNAARNAHASTAILVKRSEDYNPLPKEDDITTAIRIRKLLLSVKTGFKDLVIVAKDGICYSFAEETVTID